VTPGCHQSQRLLLLGVTESPSHQVISCRGVTYGLFRRSAKTEGTGEIPSRSYFAFQAMLYFSQYSLLIMM
jgi:hypothetical protein